MKAIHGIAASLLWMAADVAATDLPVLHEEWPPEVFASAYRLIATEEEQATLDTLTGPARRDFLAHFWMRRDPTPSTPENEFKEQFRERVETALLWFKTVNIQDPWDARGKVYIKFGEPDERQDSVDFWYAPMDTVKYPRYDPKSNRVTNPMERPDPTRSYVNTERCGTTSGGTSCCSFRATISITNWFPT